MIRLAPALALLLACGSASHHHATRHVRVRAAADLECSQANVTVTQHQDATSFRASGCGRQATYTLDREQLPQLSSMITEIPPLQAGRTYTAESASIPASCTNAKQIDGTPKPLPMYLPPEPCAERDLDVVLHRHRALASIVPRLRDARRLPNGGALVEITNEREFAIAYGCPEHDSQFNVISGIDFTRDHLWVVLWEHSTDVPAAAAFRLDRGRRTMFGFSTGSVGCHGDAPGDITQVVGFVLPAGRDAGV